MVPSTWHHVLGTRYLVPGTWYQVLGTKYLAPSTWYQVLGTKYLVASTWYQVLYLVPSTWYQVLGTKYLVPKLAQMLTQFYTFSNTEFAPKSSISMIWSCRSVLPSQNFDAHLFHVSKTFAFHDFWGGGGFRPPGLSFRPVCLSARSFHPVRPPGPSFRPVLPSVFFMGPRPLGPIGPIFFNTYNLFIIYLFTTVNLVIILTYMFYYI